MAIKASKKKSGLKVDFTDVETRVLPPEANYHARVAEATLEDGDKAEYIKWVFELIDEDKKINGQKVYLNTSLSAAALWNLRNLLETLGVETPDSEMELELEEYVGLELVVRIEHEDYQGKTKARVSDFMPLEETAEATDDEPAEEEVEEEVEEEEAPPPKKVVAKRPVTPVKTKKPVEEEEEVVEEEEATEEETEEVEGISADEVREMDDAELADLVKKYELPVKLKLITKASKRIAAVIDALEKAELLAA